MAISPPMPPSEVPGPIPPPQNLIAEESVLGSVLLTPDVMYGLVVDVGLRPEDFYREQHQTVYAAMLELHANGKPIDEVTVAGLLRDQGDLDAVGGPPAVEALMSAAPVAGNATEYGRIVREQALLRRLLRTTYEIQQSVARRDAAPRELVEDAERAMLEVAQDDRKKDFQAIGKVLEVELDRMHHRSQQHTEVSGTPSGFKDLDSLTGGFQPGNLIILAARPSMGKSALVTNIAENAALAGYPVALFSLEMSESELAQRFVASQAKINGEELRRGRIDERRWPKILQACQKLEAAPLFVDDTSDLSLLELRAKARRLHQQLENGLGLIIVDYIQLMRTDHRVESRVEQIGQLSRGMKILAGELQCPVIALSQLSRAVEQRGGEKKPILSDLRESGNLEQDADLVMFIYREEYYEKENSDRPGEADILVAKHRNGPVNDIVLTFRKELPAFMNYVGEDRFAA